MGAIPQAASIAFMPDKPSKPDQQSPADIAREAFRRLAMRRIVPTPEAYQEAYDEVAGIKRQSAAEKILIDFAARLGKGRGEIPRLARRFSSSMRMRDWEDCGQQLTLLAERHLLQPAANEDGEPQAPDKTVAANKVTPAAKPETIPLVDEIAPPPPPKKIPIPLVEDIEPPRSKPSIPLVDEIDPPSAQTASISLVKDIEAQELADAEPLPETPAPLFNDTRLTRMMREMLVRALNFAIPALLQDAKALVKESEALAVAVGAARNKQALADLEPRFKDFYFKVDMESGDAAEERELLVRLFKLLIENIGELVEDDSWLAGQIANVQQILSGPINYAVLLDATRSLKEVIYKQSLLKHSLAEAKTQVKEMVVTVIDGLGAIASNTGDFHKKVEDYSQKISQAKGVGDLNLLLDNMLKDTRHAQEDALRSQHNIIEVQREAQQAEARIHELEAQLTQMSILAYEDQLTGSLNRRGLDDVLEREMSRAERKNFPLCVALLDLDDFKKLNDNYGHGVGDDALVHLVRVVRDTLRSMDVIARFGGEEFLLVLPHISPRDAIQTVTRVQRELTKQIFMHNNERLLITFSAGVALRKAGEDQAALIARADEALYKAKKAGKNRVVAAD